MCCMICDDENTCALLNWDGGHLSDLEILHQQRQSGAVCQIRAATARATPAPAKAVWRSLVHSAARATPAPAKHSGEEHELFW